MRETYTGDLPLQCMVTLHVKQIAGKTKEEIYAIIEQKADSMRLAIRDLVDRWFRGEIE